MIEKLLYCTADSIGETSGGGLVTFNESEALKSLGPCEVLGRHNLKCNGDDPWGWDASTRTAIIGKTYKLAHFYAGTFSDTVRFLREAGCKATYTAAAHDVEISRREHEKYGIPYNYPHLTDPKLWKRYLQGYKDANVLICPSEHSLIVMRKFFCENRIIVIPHGVTLPEKVEPLPYRFTVGYLGSCGAPDKGVIYLLQAWKKLNYRDSTLILAGRDSTSPFVRGLVEHYGGGSIVLAGWQKDVTEFYNGISLYVQPSSTEGFGCEVLEAQAYNRPVICSDGAGAADTIPDAYKIEAGNVDQLASAIRAVRCKKLPNDSGWRDNAARYTWDTIRQRYVDVWKGLLQ